MGVLFNSGLSANNYPIKLMYTETAHTMPFAAQAMFVVPKRNFKHANDRNTLKRRMREAYRLNKTVFYDQLQNANKKLIIAFIFTSKKAEDYATIERATKKLLEKVLK